MKLNLYFFLKFIETILSQSRKFRLLILLIIDIFLVQASICFSIWFTTEKNLYQALTELSSAYYIFVLIFSMIVYLTTNQYKGLTSYVGSISLYKVYERNILIFFLSYLIVNLNINAQRPELKTLITFAILLNFLVGSTRFILRDLILKTKSINHFNKIKVAIYGVNELSIQYLSSIRSSPRFEVICLVDDSQDLLGRSISDIPIKSSKSLKKIVEKIDRLVLADPGLDKSQLNYLVEILLPNSIKLFKLSPIAISESGNSITNKIKPITIYDLLGREEVSSNDWMKKSSLKGLNVCIVGGGGSIGKELCTQIQKLNPKKIVIIDSSEFNLFNIRNKLLANKIENIQYEFSLGNACNFKIINDIFSNESIDIVFHAAAYKHVPIVEKNPVEGLENNILSTINICKAVKKNNLKKMIFISTDKAVNPTNIMGASKRVAELVVKDFALQEKIKNNSSIKFAIVRFGNVLGSSGSVVPIFQNQISKGGPITITDKNIIRYFMTIPEAAQLVIQAAALAKGGEIFILDMGKPVKILDLAKQMINLSGLTLKDKNNEKGDIAIVETGLRPGEKLYEELLISGKSKKTINPLIFEADEHTSNDIKILEGVKLLENYIKNRDIQNLKKLLSKLVPEWVSSCD